VKYTIYFIDAFTDTLFSGNPAAVLLLDRWLDEALMQSIAVENNLSETAFVVKEKEKYHIRWFSPLQEIDFCGHATLASAYVLFSSLKNAQTLTFTAKAIGTFSVYRLEDQMFEMDFPFRAPVQIEEIPEALLEGLSIKPIEVYRSQQAYFAIYEKEEQVKALTQNVEMIKKLAPYDTVVTAVASSQENYDFISRYFWPANGGEEDPVTGSIHAGLAPFWSERLHKEKLVAYQASSRGGVLYCRIKDERVYISGKVVQYLKGIIEI